MQTQATGISDEDLHDVRDLVRQGRAIPAAVVRGILARLDHAEQPAAPAAKQHLPFLVAN